jgi:hypothetical protein
LATPPASCSSIVASIVDTAGRSRLASRQAPGGAEDVAGWDGDRRSCPRGRGRPGRGVGPALRRRTEACLRDLFAARGGTPERLSPHYFILGESDWYEGLAIGMQRVQLALSDLPEDQTTVTYSDSFTAIGFGPEFTLVRRCVLLRASGRLTRPAFWGQLDGGRGCTVTTDWSGDGQADLCGDRLA